MARWSSCKGRGRRKGKEVVVEALHHASSKGRSSHLLHLRRSHSSRRAAVSEHSGQEAPARMVHKEEAEEARVPFSRPPVSGKARRGFSVVFAENDIGSHLLKTT